jgi:hypothetical protein
VVAEVTKIIKQKQPFERMVITKEEGLELFADNPFKVSILTTKVPDGGRTTVYRCGDLIDLCRGPHVSHTGKVKAFAATRHSSTNWLGDTDNDSLQRLYGISFPDKKQLKVWQENQEKVGCQLEPTERYDSWPSRDDRKTNLILGKYMTDNRIPLILLSLRRNPFYVYLENIVTELFTHLIIFFLSAGQRTRSSTDCGQTGSYHVP